MGILKIKPTTTLCLFAFALSANNASAAAAKATYRVQPDQNLSEICILLYGNTKLLRKIASLNSLKPPAFSLRAGKLLELPTAPTISAKEGQDILVRIWEQKLSERDGVTPEPQKINVISIPSTTDSRPVGEKEQEVVKAFQAFKREQKDEGAEGEYAAGTEALKTGNLEKAEAYFHHARKVDPAHVPSWLAELRVARMAHDSKKTHALACGIAKRFPQLKELPLITGSMQGKCDFTSTDELEHQ